jgi:hypothetical protein
MHPISGQPSFLHHSHLFEMILKAQSTLDSGFDSYRGQAKFSACPVCTPFYEHTLFIKQIQKVVLKLIKRTCKATVQILLTNPIRSFSTRHVSLVSLFNLGISFTLQREDIRNEGDTQDIDMKCCKPSMRPKIY